MYSNYQNMDNPSSLRKMAVVAGIILLLEILFDILSELIVSIVLSWIYLGLFAISFVFLMTFLKKLSRHLSLNQNTFLYAEKISSGANFVLIYMIFKIAELLLFSFVDLTLFLLFVLLFGPPIVKSIGFSKAYNGLKDFGYKGFQALVVYAYNELVAVVLIFFLIMGEAGQASDVIISISFWIDVCALGVISIAFIIHANKLSIVGQLAAPLQQQLGPSVASPEQIYQSSYYQTSPTQSAVERTQEMSEATPKFCTNCGAKIKPSDKFCIYCGEKLEQ